MPKPLNIIIAIIAIAAAIGSLFAMYFLFSFGSAMGEFTAGFAELGAEPADIAAFQEQLSFILTLGWLWAITVLITSVYAIKTALFAGKKK